MRLQPCSARCLLLFCFSACFILFSYDCKRKKKGSARVVVTKKFLLKSFFDWSFKKKKCTGRNKWWNIYNCKFEHTYPSAPPPPPLPVTLPAITVEEIDCRIEHYCTFPFSLSFLLRSLPPLSHSHFNQSGNIFAELPIANSIRPPRAAAAALPSGLPPCHTTYHQQYLPANIYIALEPKPTTSAWLPSITRNGQLWRQ